jgi:hypothetical protein
MRNFRIQTIRMASILYDLFELGVIRLTHLPTTPALRVRWLYIYKKTKAGSSSLLISRVDFGAHNMLLHIVNFGSPSMIFGVTGLLMY